MAVDENLITEWERDYLTADTNSPQDNTGDINALLDDHMRNYKSVVRLEADNKPWFEPFPPGTLFTHDFLVSGDNITISGGNHTAVLEVGRRLRITFDDGVAQTEVGGYVVSATHNAGPNTTTLHFNSQRVRDDFTTRVYLGSDDLRVTIPGVGPSGGRVLLLYNDTILFRGDLPVADGRMFTRGPVFWDPIMDGYNITFGTLGSQVSILPEDTPWVFGHRMIESTTAITSFEVGSINRESANQQTHQSGSVQMLGNGTVGPYEVTLPLQHVNGNYQVHLQVTGISHDPPTAPSTYNALLLSVETKTANSFTIRPADVIAIGNIITVDWIIGN